MSDKDKVSCPVTDCSFSVEVHWTGRVAAIRDVFMLAEHLRTHDALDLVFELLKRKLNEHRQTEISLAGCAGNIGIYAGNVAVRPEVTK